MYLIANSAGPAKYRGKANSHFNPQAALFKASQAMSVVKVRRRCCRGCLYRPSSRAMCLCCAVQSDIGFAIAVSILGYCIAAFGWSAVWRLYVIPYLVVNANLVLITYLQHTAPYVPHYRNVSLPPVLSTLQSSHV